MRSSTLEDVVGASLLRDSRRGNQAEIKASALEAEVSLTLGACAVSEIEATTTTQAVPYIELLKILKYACYLRPLSKITLMNRPLARTPTIVQRSLISTFTLQSNRSRMQFM